MVSADAPASRRVWPQRFQPTASHIGGCAELISTFFGPAGKPDQDNFGTTLKSGSIRPTHKLEEATTSNAGRGRRGVLQPIALENTPCATASHPRALAAESAHENSGLWAGDLVLSPGTKATLQRAALLSRNANREAPIPANDPAPSAMVRAPTGQSDAPPSPPPEEDFIDTSVVDDSSSLESNMLIQTTSFTQTTIILSERKRKTTRNRNESPQRTHNGCENVRLSQQDFQAAQILKDQNKSDHTNSLAVTIGDSSAPSLTGISSPGRPDTLEQPSLGDEKEGSNRLERTKETLNATADMSAILAVHAGLVQKYANMPPCDSDALTRAKHNESEFLMDNSIAAKQESCLSTMSPMLHGNAVHTVSAAWGASPVVFWESSALRSRRESRGPLTILTWRSRQQLRDNKLALAQVSPDAVLNARAPVASSTSSDGIAPLSGVALDATHHVQRVEVARSANLAPTSAVHVSVPRRVAQVVSSPADAPPPEERRRDRSRKTLERRTGYLVDEYGSEAVAALTLAPAAVTEDQEHGLDHETYGHTKTDRIPVQKRQGASAVALKSHGGIVRRPEVCTNADAPANKRSGLALPATRGFPERTSDAAEPVRTRDLSPRACKDGTKDPVSSPRGRALQRHRALEPLTLPPQVSSAAQKTCIPPKTYQGLPPRISRRPPGDERAPPRLPAFSKHLEHERYRASAEQSLYRVSVDAAAARERPPPRRHTLPPGAAHRPPTVAKTPHLETERRARLRAAADAAAKAASIHQSRTQGARETQKPANSWKPRITVPQTPNVLRHTSVCRRERPKTKEEMDLEEMERGRQAILRMREANERSRRRCLRVQTCTVYRGALDEQVMHGSDDCASAAPGMSGQSSRARSVGTGALFPPWFDKPSTPEPRRRTMPAPSDTTYRTASPLDANWQASSPTKCAHPAAPSTLGLFRKWRS